MIAVLEWVDGFGNDTYVTAVFPTLKEAEEYVSKNSFWDCTWQEFDFGEVDFDYSAANPFTKPEEKED